MDNAMTITNAQYCEFDGENDLIKATINGKEMTVPLDADNIHYAAILEWVAEGNTIASSVECGCKSVSIGRACTYDKRGGN